MCSCNKVTRAPYGAAIYRGLSAMLPPYRGWRLDSRVGSWLAVGGSFDEPAQLVDVAHAPLHVSEGGHDGPSFLLGEVA